MKQHHTGLNEINIDVGGTFTDCVVTLGGQHISAKAPTNHTNLTEGFLLALQEAESQSQLSARQIMERIEVIRYSTTLAINKLLEQRGTKLGLLTTEGFEDSIIIGKGAQWADGLLQSEKRNLAKVVKPLPLIARDRIVGVRERTDYTGRVLRPLDENDVRDKLAILIGKGVKGIVVSLLWAHQRPDHEIRVREIIEEEYPELSIGSMPVVLSHEVAPRKGEYRRTITAVLNTYLHRPMAEDLQRLRKELRSLGYRKEILIARNSGSLGDIMTTTAIETYGGGPAAGLMGCLELAKQYGFPNVVTTDMGGTSFDVGVIRDGYPRVSGLRPPTIDHWAVHTTSVETRSIGAGGGSIAWIDPVLGNLVVGPMSAGSVPGPASYNFGGTAPTVTDADLVLGYLNPDRYHGGKIPLHRDLALKSIKESIAHPLSLSTEEAAIQIRRLINGTIGNALYRETVLRGIDPRDCILFCFGGAGPAHCCDYSQTCKIDRIVSFPFSPVFSAYMSSFLPIRQIYEISKRLQVQDSETGLPCLDLDLFNKTADRLISDARQGAIAEGLKPDNLSFLLEIDMKHEDQLHLKRVSCSHLKLSEEHHTIELLDAFTGKASDTSKTIRMRAEGGVSIEGFILHSLYSAGPIQFPVFDCRRSSPPSQAKSGKRSVYWETEARFSETQIYDVSQMICGNTIDGPAIIEADHTTFVLPRGHRFTIDKYMNYQMERVT